MYLFVQVKATMANTAPAAAAAAIAAITLLDECGFCDCDGDLGKC